MNAKAKTDPERAHRRVVAAGASCRPYEATRGAPPSAPSRRWPPRSREYGFRQPIVVDAEGVIIAGHTRLLAAEAAALPTYRCTWRAISARAGARLSPGRQPHRRGDHLGPRAAGRRDRRPARARLRPRAARLRAR